MKHLQESRQGLFEHNKIMPANSRTYIKMCYNMVTIERKTNLLLLSFDSQLIFQFATATVFVIRHNLLSPWFWLTVNLFWDTKHFIPISYKQPTSQNEGFPILWYRCVFVLQNRMDVSQIPAWMEVYAEATGGTTCVCVKRVMLETAARHVC